MSTTFNLSLVIDHWCEPRDDMRGISLAAHGSTGAELAMTSTAGRRPSPTAQSPWLPTHRPTNTTQQQHNTTPAQRAEVSNDGRLPANPAPRRTGKLHEITTPMTGRSPASSQIDCLTLSLLSYSHRLIDSLTGGIDRQQHANKQDQVQLSPPAAASDTCRLVSLPNYLTDESGAKVFIVLSSTPTVPCSVTAELNE